ncbi:hypothetical protein TH63_11025 [Rufibacter radiotolerans]|uniref:Uncharacterized protein n=1 Tax=Rufibacter radiotolerans TaxID=1379910 RepID=A0A0H4VQ41_9BACT|nr:hypothetical protein [Rufibacter radiotolerans]AKQ46052.1 hypothetical protein TH63_11025 [Rufibacter radiotolerans]
MLKLGGYINLLIAFVHLIGLIWMVQVFKLFGISKQMNELSEIHSSFPYLLTIVVALVFFVFGLYGLLADDKLPKMPFLKPVIFLIGGIYIFRGLGELIYETTRSKHSTTEIAYSFVALAIGLLYLIGGFKKWKVTRKKNNERITTAW